MAATISSGATFGATISSSARATSQAVFMVPAAGRGTVALLFAGMGNPQAGNMV
jgi:hypothetical protein